MPDDALLADAANSTLRNENVLAAQVDRMLADQRSDEFVQSFVWAWLKLQNTVEMAPDPMKFYEYHRNRLGDAMIIETNAFFRHLLTENLSISNFIDSDFAIINVDLGRHYGISGAANTTAQFQKVDHWDASSRRPAWPDFRTDGISERSGHVARRARNLDSRKPARHATVSTTAGC